MKTEQDKTTTISVPKSIHRQLSNMAMEQTIEKERRVRIWEIIQDLLK